MARKGNVYIGTSGWDYDGWQGAFYPDEVPKARRLEHLADRFDAVEVNGSFYRVPDPETVAAWAARTPTRCRFVLKMWRGVTQYKKLADCTDHLERFFASADALPTDRRGPVLVQTPPNLGKDLGRLDAFIDMVRDVTAPDRWKIAFEPRHPSWLDEDVVDLLDDRGVARVLHDMEDAAPVDTPNDASFVYLRRHGPGGDHAKGYDADTVRGDARRITEWAAEGRTVYVFYNNDVGAHAPRDAMRLMRSLEERDKEILAHA